MDRGSVLVDNSLLDRSGLRKRNGRITVEADDSKFHANVGKF